MQLLINKKAQHDFEFLKKFQAGVLLSGPEVKSLRLKKGSLRGSFVKIINGEVFLIGAQINPYEYADNREYDPIRTRKLLLSKKEIAELAAASERKGVSLVPLSWETVGRTIKLNLAISRGKKEYEKRSLLKKKAQQRDVEREVKHRF